MKEGERVREKEGEQESVREKREGAMPDMKEANVKAQEEESEN